MTDAERFAKGRAIIAAPRRGAPAVATRRVVLGAVLCAGWGALAAAAAAAEPESANRQDILFLGSARIIVIRLHLELDGAPFGDTWRRTTREIFAVADGDGDGQLNEAERQSAIDGQRPLADEASAVLTMPGLPQADVDPPDGLISFDEFARFVRHSRGGPFQAGEMVERSVAGRAGTMNGSVDAGQLLFQLLDANADGRLTVEELRQGPESIRKFDFDGDAASSVEELDHLRINFGGGMANSTTSAEAPLIAIVPAQLSGLLDRLLLRARPAAGTGVVGLPIDRLSLGEAAPRFDLDGNGVLDRDELRYFLAHPEPHIEVRVRIGSRQENLAAVEVVVPPSQQGLEVKSGENGLISLVVDSNQIEFSAGSMQRSEGSIRESFARRFDRADRDGNGYLEQPETENFPLFAESFSRFDRDGDGKIFKEEMLGAIDGSIKIGLSRTRMTSADRGQDLFQILDTNRDRRLTRRELQAAMRRMALWDTDGDAELRLAEIPQLYQLVFDRGLPDLPGMTDEHAPGQVPPTSPLGRSGPGWFQKMDRNGDGDVSAIEFLGTSEQFRLIDSNQDELIDAREAEDFPPTN